MLAEAILARALAVAAALFLNAGFGALADRIGWGLHRGNPFDRPARWLVHRLDRRSERDRQLRGAVVTLMLALAAAAIGWGLAGLLAAHGHGVALAAVGLALLIEQQGVFRRVRRVANALQPGGSVSAAREAVAMLGDGGSDMDQHAIARRAIEEAAMRFSHGVVAPAFWFVFLGWPALLAWLAVDAVLRASPGRGPFGMAARAAELVLAFLPTRFAGALLAIASVFVPGAQPQLAVPTMMRRMPGLRWRNAAWPLGAVAGVLGLALAGPARGEPWIGDGRARATSGDVNRALLMYALACVFVLTGSLAAGLALLLLGK